MELELVNSLAVVVGGASGIGRAIAAEFAREGARVAILDRSLQTSVVAAELQREFGSDVFGWQVDVTNPAAIATTASELSTRCGAVEHVVYAAGMGSGKFGFPFWNLSPADWEPMFRVNLFGAVNIAHAFAPGMSERKRGSWLLISSVAGQIGSQTDPPYSAAKAALINFAQCMAKDLAPYDVRVNVICPGMVQTPLNQAVWQAWNDRQPVAEQRSYADWAGEKIAKLTPLGRWQEPRDIATLAVFLASAKAKNITGQTMNVDGGWVMHW